MQVVDISQGTGRLPRRHLRPTNNQRRLHAVLVQALFAHKPVLAEAQAVIGGVNNIGNRWRICTPVCTGFKRATCRASHAQTEAVKDPSRAAGQTTTRQSFRASRRQRAQRSHCIGRSVHACRQFENHRAMARAGQDTHAGRASRSNHSGAAQQLATSQCCPSPTNRSTAHTHGTAQRRHSDT